MALDGTYGGLKASVADWLNRADLTTQIVDFIALFEAQMNRSLRTRDMIVRTQAPISTQYVQLPADYLQCDYLALFGSDGNAHPLTHLSAAETAILQSNAAPTFPTNYTVIGSTLEFAPVPASTYTAEMIYHAKIPALSAGIDAAGNWLLTKSPDLYLYGSLLQAAPFLQNDERISTWGAAVSGILDQMTVESERATVTGQPLKLKVRPFGQVRSR